MLPTVRDCLLVPYFGAHAFFEYWNSWRLSFCAHCDYRRFAKWIPMPHSPLIWALHLNTVVIKRKLQTWFRERSEQKFWRIICAVDWTNLKVTVCRFWYLTGIYANKILVGHWISSLIIYLQFFLRIGRLYCIIYSSYYLTWPKL
jgi:hypothetical protein